MRVYRIEHRESKWGPYLTDGSHNFLGEYSWAVRDHQGPTHPCPYEDVTQDSISLAHAASHLGRYAHGVTSQKLLREWFNQKERRTLERLGFDLVVLDVPVGSYEKGRRQVLFTRSAAVELERRSPVSV